jgi:hypothetical protein
MQKFPSGLEVASQALVGSRFLAKQWRGLFPTIVRKLPHLENARLVP